MTNEQIIDNEYWKKKYADIHIRLSNKIAELQEQLKRKKQKLEKIKELLEPIKCKNPESCWENKSDWNGEVYGCEPDDMDNIASCPSKVATSVLQIIEGKENE